MGWLVLATTTQQPFYGGRGPQPEKASSREHPGLCRGECSIETGPALENHGLETHYRTFHRGLPARSSFRLGPSPQAHHPKAHHAKRETTLQAPGKCRHVWQGLLTI
jgi:hypothetical protein